MPALVVGTHVFPALRYKEDVDGDKPGHDETWSGVNEAG
jgi:hypothetical protein